MINEFPDVLDIEPIHTCNLRCKMCHVSTEKLSHEKLDIARFLHALNGWTDRYAYVGSTHEPMAHPNFAALLRGLNDLKARLIITTNATLAPPPAVAALSDSKLERLYISFDGVTKETYEAVRRGGNFERTLGAVDRLIACKGHGVVSVNYTLMASSLADARRAVAFWEKRGVDGIGFIVAVRRSDLEEARAECLVDRSEEVASIMEEIALQVINEKKRIWVSSPIYSEPGFQSRYGAYTDANVVFGVPGGKRPPNPKQELVSIAYSGMPIPCSAPFRNARVLYNGNVLLCDKLSIGNIYQATLAEIWNSKAAEAIRETVKQEGNPLCSSCDYYRFCLRARTINIRDKTTFVTSKLGKPSSGAVT